MVRIVFSGARMARSAFFEVRPQQLVLIELVVAGKEHGLGFLRQLVHDDESIVVNLGLVLGWKELAGENVTFLWSGAKEDRWERWDRSEWFFGGRAAVERMLQRSNEGHSIRGNRRVSCWERAISLLGKSFEGLYVFRQGISELAEDHHQNLVAQGKWNRGGNTS